MPYNNYVQLNLHIISFIPIDLICDLNKEKRVYITFPENDKTIAYQQEVIIAVT